jgi:hypothetical protein
VEAFSFRHGRTFSLKTLFLFVGPCPFSRVKIPWVKRSSSEKSNFEPVFYYEVERKWSFAESLQIITPTG